MASAKLSDTTVEKLAAVQKQLGMAGVDGTLAFIVDRFHAAYLDAALPDGWALNDDLSLADMETYFEAYAAEEGTSKNAWAERGRTIRAALVAGWIKTPIGLTNEAIGRLKPAEAARLKNALDAHYLKLTIADPN